MERFTEGRVAAEAAMVDFTGRELVARWGGGLLA
jgi:hypothetical protein